MAKAKIDKVGLFCVLFWFVVIGAVYYFGYTTHWGAELLNAFGILMLFWGFLSPLYLLIRMGMVQLRRRKAARLGLTFEAFEAKRKGERGGTRSATMPSRSQHLARRWGRRLLRIQRWELGVFTALLVLFGGLAQHWRQQPGEHVGVTVVGLLYAMALYTLVGLQMLHRVWAQWHHRLAPGSVAAAEAAPEETLSGAQLFWNCTFLLSLVFAMAELAMTGEGEMLAVVFAFVAPALLVLLLASVWRMLRPLFRHRRVEPVSQNLPVA